MTAQRDERTADRERSTVSRRGLLRAAGVGIAGLAAGTGSAGATRDASAASRKPWIDAPDHPLDRSPGAAFAPHDGFARMDWFDDSVDVYRVTNLDESGRGSLRWAVEQYGPRVVVFEVGGTIDLEERALAIPKDECWIAGQTAPSPGITLIRGELRVNADDCVVQHLRVRPGDAGNDSGWEPDGIRTADGAANNVVDHCSVSWGIDENTSPGYGAADTTYSNCIVAEPLHDATHHKGPHGYGMLVGDDATGNAIVGNLFVHNVRRTPRLKEGTEAVVVNNVFCDMDTGTNTDFEGTYSIVGNRYDRGRSERLINGSARGDQAPTAYIADNEATFEAETTNGQFDRRDSPPVWPDGLSAIPVDDVLSHVAVHAGARPTDRTGHDVRAVEDALNGTGGVVDSQGEVGGYPNLRETTRSLSVPDDGLGDWLYGFTREVERDVTEYVGPGPSTAYDALPAARDRDDGVIDRSLARRVGRAVGLPGRPRWL